jgi:hypothetical protein
LLADGDLVALSDDGESSCRGNAMDSPTARAVAHATWTSAVEPHGRVNGLSSELLAVALRADGTGMTDAIFDSGGALTTASSSESRFAALLAVTAVDGPTPPPRDGYASVFSRRAGGAFVIGGVDANAALQRDAWFLPFGGSWTAIGLGEVELGRVLAATYAFADDRLWLVDEVDEAASAGKNKTRARVLRVDPSGAGASVVSFAPRRRPGLTAFLSVDRDGTPLLALASDASFALLRLRQKANGLAVGRVRTERGKLVRAPIVDDFGYSFVVAAANGNLRIKRRDLLRPVACDDDVDDEDDKRPRFSNAPDCDAALVEKLF